MISALCMSIAEIAFIIQFSFAGITNMVGHFFKICAFYTLYLTVFDSGVEKPLQNLMKNEAKDYLYWPGKQRKAQCELQLEKVLKITRT